MILLDLAYHYGSEQDKAAADMLQKRLLHDDSKDCGLLNRIVLSMKEFKKHDKKIAQQGRRESRGYAADMVKAMHVVLRIYERLSKSHFSVKKRTRYQSTCAELIRPKQRPHRKSKKSEKSTEEEESRGCDDGDDEDANSENVGGSRVQQVQCGAGKPDLYQAEQGHSVDGGTLEQKRLSTEGGEEATDTGEEDAVKTAAASATKVAGDTDETRADAPKGREGILRGTVEVLEEGEPSSDVEVRACVFVSWLPKGLE